LSLSNQPYPAFYIGEAFDIDYFNKTFGKEEVSGE
jgi:hypothetical protein